MEYYPVIAEVEYKNKYITFNTKVRVKLAIFKDYVCHKCSTITDVKHLLKYFNGLVDGLAINETTSIVFDGVYITMPKHLTDGKNISCPKCYEFAQEFNFLKSKEVKKIKVYVTSSKRHEYFDVEKILNRITYFRFREYQMKMNHHYAAFEPDMDKVYMYLKHSKEMKFKKGESLMVKINKRITLKKLEKAEDDYQKRKFVQVI